MSAGVLSSVRAPSGWRFERFDRVVRLRKEDGSPGLEPLSVFLDQGVVPRASREDNYNRLGADLSRYLVVRPGDIVFNRLRTWQGGVGVSQHTGLVSPVYYVCEPREDVEPRYLHHLLRSSVYLAELTRISKWMPPAQFDISWDELRLLPTLLPPLGEQKDAADYLDRETARIDGLVLYKEELTTLLVERLEARVSELTNDENAGWVPLRKFLVSIEQGYSPVCDSRPADDDEWGVLKLSAVDRGRFRPEENKALPPLEAPHESYAVRKGDVLVTRSNTPELVGDVCVVREEPPKVLLPDLIYRLNLLPGSFDSRYLGFVLLGRRTRGLMSAVARGSSRSMVKLRGEDIGSIPVPRPDLAEQRRVADELDARAEAVRRTIETLGSQINRLRERRQALTTAAVTGQIDIDEAV